MVPVKRKQDGVSKLEADKKSAACRDEPYDDDMTPEYEAFLAEKLAYLDKADWESVGEAAW